MPLSMSASIVAVGVGLPDRERASGVIERKHEVVRVWKVNQPADDEARHVATDAAVRYELQSMFCTLTVNLQRWFPMAAQCLQQVACCLSFEVARVVPEVEGKACGHQPWNQVELCGCCCNVVAIAH